MSDNQIQWKPIVVSSLVGGGLMGTLEYATYNRRLFKSGELSERQFTNIAEALAKKFPEEEKKLIEASESSIEEYYKRLLGLYRKCCNESGKLVHDSNKISKEYFDTIKATLNKMRLQQALVWGGLFALGCTAFSLITNTIQAKKSKPEKSKQL